ncbi:Heat shock 70 kDa protein 1 [Trichinella papuae]|uniref:Heat shock 70 kDa protein 1 n=1 Tax=Trichinella papuae TaxID=268474 RepID=A0A0V1N3S1_9BILA|nr:Heat shock 70 kDa protein 1 [Trichinella papuae]
MNNYAIGIDFGMLNCSVGCFYENDMHIFTNERGDQATPNFVSFTERVIYVGNDAKERLIINPYNTIYEFKRFLGRSYDEPYTQYCIKRLPYNVVERNSTVRIEVNHQNQMITFTPEELSAMLFSKLRCIAKQHLLTSVRDAVITVPSYYNNAQCLAIRDAALLANLNPIQFIDTASAVAIAYGLDRTNDGERNFLIYDLGAVTFDVTILTVENGSFNIRAVGSNTHFGGEDFLNRLVDYYLNDFKKETGKDVHYNVRAISRLRRACEYVKCRLSSEEEARIELDTFHEAEHLYRTVTRKLFEKINEDLFLATLNTVKQTLKDAEMVKEDVDDVILVGGSTLIPKIQEIIQHFFNGKKPTNFIDPKFVVTYGAALQAARLVQQRNKEEIVAEKEKLLELAPLSIGIETANGLMNVLIARNTPLPTSATCQFTTQVDYQACVLINVYEGERALVKNNKLLGKCVLENFILPEAGLLEITVECRLNQKGELVIEAHQFGDHHVAKFSYTYNEEFIKEPDVAHIVQEAESFKEEDDKLRELINAKTNLENYITAMQSTVNSKVTSKDLKTDDRNAMVEKCEETLDWMKTHDQAEEEDFVQKLKDLQTVCNPIFQRLINAAFNEDFENFFTNVKDFHYPKLVLKCASDSKNIH